MREVTPEDEAAETTEDPFRGVWTVHTVESWARAIIDDMAREVKISGGSGVEFEATYRCMRDEDGSFRAAIQIKGQGTYNVHRVKVG